MMIHPTVYISQVKVVHLHWHCAAIRRYKKAISSCQKHKPWTGKLTGSFSRSCLLYIGFLCDVTPMNRGLIQFHHSKNWMWCLLPFSSLRAFLLCLNHYATLAPKQWWLIILSDLIRTVLPTGPVHSSWGYLQAPPTIHSFLRDSPRLPSVAEIQLRTTPSEGFSPPNHSPRVAEAHGIR